MQNKTKYSVEDVSVAWQKFQEPWYLIENLITKEKIILKGLKGLIEYRLWTERYGAANCTCLRVDAKIGDTLYGTPT
jgi:hypothetical protein